MPASSFWSEFRAQSGAKEVGDILGERVFAFPKPLGVVQKVVDHCAPPDCLILDSFAGTGTTAHAVLAQNMEDGGKRRFILIEMEENIARDVTAPRIRQAIEGYDGGKPLGGGFRYCKLSHPIFDAEGQIHEEVRFADLAAHVFFTDTGEPIPKRPSGKQPSPLLGVCNGTAVYLLFNGVLGDKRPDGGNVLTSKVLEDLPAHDGPRVVYGEGCRLGAVRLKRAGVTFKQVPYEIKVS